MLRVYLDTSVFGGYYDDEFKQSTVPLFNALFAGNVRALISEALVAELVAAPDGVQQLLERLLTRECERLELTEEALVLRNAYITDRVVSPKWAEDALHVAHASLARADPSPRETLSTWSILCVSGDLIWSMHDSAMERWLS